MTGAAREAALPQFEIELILMRQLAGTLALPVFLVDVQGDLLFYNEPAELILGCRFEETGAMPASRWSTLFAPKDDAGRPVRPDELPLIQALGEGRPAHRSLWIRGLDDVPRRIEVSAFPLITQDRRTIGGVAIFWEAAPP
jgi:PAS domain-containing protein